MFHLFHWRNRERKNEQKISSTDEQYKKYHIRRPNIRFPYDRRSFQGLFLQRSRTCSSLEYDKQQVSTICNLIIRIH